MDAKIAYDEIYVPSDTIAVKEIEGRLTIVPYVPGIGYMEDEIFTLSETGRAIWEKLDGKKTLQDVARELYEDFKASHGEIEKDVIRFAEELIKRKILVRSL